MAFVAVAAVAVGATRNGGGNLNFGRPAMTYHVEYAVTHGAARSTEELWVARPFASEQLVYASGDRKHPMSRIVSHLGRQLLATGGAPAVFEVAPRPAQLDQRVDAVVAVAPKNALVHRGRRTVAGVACQVLRTRLVLATDFAGPPTSDDHVDSCVSADAILLEETAVRNGGVVSHKVATRVSSGPHVPGDAFVTAGDHVPRSQGGGRVLTLDPSSRPPGQTFWELASPPPGFRHLGRFAVIAPTAPSAPVVTSIDDVFVRDAEVIVVEQGETLSGARVAAQEGAPVRLGALGHGSLLVSPVASSVAALTKTSGSFVRVTGTVAPGRLVAVARALRAQPAGVLVTIPDLTSDGAA